MAAVTEAAQSRLTAISGARDDILHAASRPRRAAFGVAPPIPPCLRPISWDDVETFCEHPIPTAEGLAEALASAGYPDAAIVDLSRPAPAGATTAVVKAVAPGLGAFARSRRPRRNANA